MSTLSGATSSQTFPVPHFNNPNLSAAAKATDIVLSKYQDRLNKLTEDILSIERYLNARGVVHHISVRIPSLDERIRPKASSKLVDGFYSLKWERPEGQLKFRLFYTLEHGPVADDIFWELHSSGILAESSVERKLAASPYLHRFIQMVGSTINDVYVSKWYAKNPS